MATMNDTDDQLVAKAVEGDGDALVALVDRHLHPAWRIALASAASAEAAEQAVVHGMCDAIRASHRAPDPLLSVRTRIAAAVYRHAAGHRGGAHPVDGDDPVLASFRRLPATSRAALWLIDVEGGAPAQVAPVLGLDREGAESLAERARSAFADRLRMDNVQTIDANRTLRRLVGPVPEGLAAAVVAHWPETGDRHRAFLRGWSERAVGAAAAAILAVGLAGFALFGGGGGDDAPQLTAPASLEQARGEAATTSSTTATTVLPAPVAFPTYANFGPSRGPLGGGAGTGARGLGPAIPAPPPGTPGAPPATAGSPSPDAPPTAPPTTAAPEPPAARTPDEGGSTPILPPPSSPPTTLIPELPPLPPLLPGGDDDTDEPEAPPTTEAPPSTTPSTLLPPIPGVPLPPIPVPTLPPLLPGLPSMPG